MSEKSHRKWFFISLLTLFVGVAFTYGVAVGQYKIWPNYQLYGVFQAGKSLLAVGRVLPENLVVKPAPNAPRRRIAIYDQKRVEPGNYVFIGWDDAHGTYAAWLYDDHGVLRYRWPVDYSALDPNGPSNHSIAPHGFKVLRDGSLLINFDRGDVMVRLDDCGRPIWIKRGYFHHSLQRGNDGTYWTWQGQMTPYSQYQYLVDFDPATGATRRRISLIRDVIDKSGQQRAIFSIPPHFHYVRYTRPPLTHPAGDIFHPNDINVLTTALAPKFPEFKAGDLLLSFRNISLVAVMDPATGKLKWWSNGPWRYQHDPQFTPSGKISVFDNNTGRGESEILQMDPLTRKVSDPLAGGNFHFYSPSMGEHQYLPNGNMLVVVPHEGRVVEVTAKGRKVFEFNNLVSGTTAYNGHVENGLWLPKGYFDKPLICRSPS